LAEALVLICDRCGSPATEAVTLRARGRNLVLDLCDRHLAELVKGARPPKRGRKPQTLVSVGASRTRSAGASTRKPGTRARTRKKAKATKAKAR
jgi:hypothetical protein